MLNHYTAAKRLRSEDAYTPGGKTGQRPDYATIVYSNILKNLYPEIPVVIGGIEASMRRFVHYDFWQNKLLTSVLESSRITSYNVCYTKLLRPSFLSTSHFSSVPAGISTTTFISPFSQTGS